MCSAPDFHDWKLPEEGGKNALPYIILRFSQSVSGLGSSMTGFMLVLWAYGQSHSAMSVKRISLDEFYHTRPGHTEEVWQTGF